MHVDLQDISGDGGRGCNVGFEIARDHVDIRFRYDGSSICVDHAMGGCQYVGGIDYGASTEWEVLSLVSYRHLYRNK